MRKKMPSLALLLTTGFIVLLLVGSVHAPPVITQLTFNTARDRDPSISADGSKIAFQSNVDGDDEIFVINSDGTGLDQLTTNTAGDWSPSINADGSQIAFQSNVDGDGEIFVINSDGTGLDQLTTNTIWDYVPSISGDGSKIAFYSDGDGDDEIFLWEAERIPDGFVIPEVPLGTIMASAAMIIALVAYVTMPKWRRKPI